VSKKAKHAVSLLVFAACCFYLLDTYNSLESVSTTDKEPTLDLFNNPIGLFFATLLFCFSNLLAAQSWRLLSDPNSNRLARYSDACRIWSVSNIAKYLPGNIFQYIYRFQLSKQAGIQSQDNIIGIITEAGLISLAALILCLPGLIFNRHAFIGIDLSILTIKPLDLRSTSGLILNLALVILLFLLLVKFTKQKNVVAKATRFIESIVAHLMIRRAILPAAFLCSLINFGLATFAAIALLDVNTSYSVITTITVLLTAYSLAFLLGYIVPGAPGGLGVREAVLVALLAPYFGTVVALSLTLQLRLASMFADALLGIVCHISTHQDSLDSQFNRT